MKKLPLFLLALLAFIATSGQISINPSGSPPDSSAMLDLGSNSRGLLIPRMTDTEIMAIVNPANGLQVFCTSDEKLYVFIAGENRWKEMAFGTSEIIRPAVITLGAGTPCGSSVTFGIYMAGVPMIRYNYVTLQVVVVMPGTWLVNTDTVNGYYFSGSGSFMFPGPQTITLQAYGTPLAAQTDQFTLVSPGNAGSCLLTVSVNPLQPCGSPFTDSRDGKSYNTVMITGQCWMSQNLNVGTRLAYNLQQTNNGTPEKYCFGNNETNCNIYGGLYQWAEAVQYLNGATNDSSWNPVPSGNVTGICPQGWHLPTTTEWNIATSYLGGDSVAGGKMKETGTAHWLAPNQGATNNSGFTGLGGGYRTINSTTENLKWAGNFWTATESVTSLAYVAQYFQLVYYLERSAINDWGTKQSGHSVRCIKDL